MAQRVRDHPDRVSTGHPARCDGGRRGTGLTSATRAAGEEARTALEVASLSDIISPDPVTEWLPAHLPAYLSNGLVGLRMGTLPWKRGVTTINGFEGMDPTIDVEAIALAPYVLGGDLSIGRVCVSDRK